MLEKNFGPLTEAMHIYVNRGERFSMDILTNLLWEIINVVDCLKQKEESICLFSLSSRYGCPKVE